MWERGGHGRRVEVRLQGRVWTSRLFCGPRLGGETVAEAGTSCCPGWKKGTHGGKAQVGTALVRGSFCPPPPPEPVLPLLCPQAGRARSLPGERVPGQGMRVLQAGMGCPSLKAVFIFKPLLPKCQLRLFFEISHSPQGHRALLKTLIKLFVGRNQIVGPSVSRFLESPVPDCVASLCRSSREAARGLGRPLRSC